MTRSSQSPSSVDKFWEKAYLNKLIPPCDLATWAEKVRKRKKTIVTLNGSFDLLHAGHLHIIYEASKQGDILLLALNTDASIKGYKGLNRPLIDLENRLKMVSALQFVDHITYFDEPNPLPLLEKVQPNVHVNGSEYGKECLEASTVKRYGGKIHIVDLIPGLSTTNLIEKIKCV